MIRSKIIFPLFALTLLLLPRPLRAALVLGVAVLLQPADSSLPAKKTIDRLASEWQGRKPSVSSLIGSHSDGALRGAAWGRGAPLGAGTRGCAQLAQRRREAPYVRPVWLTVGHAARSALATLCLAAPCREGLGRPQQRRATGRQCRATPLTPSHS